jgi:hypothetical protein
MCVGRPRGRRGAPNSRPSRLGIADGVGSVTPAIHALSVYVEAKTGPNDAAPLTPG